MNDKKLLEAAAKVSGIDLNDYEWIEGDGVGTYFMAAGDASHSWNPLENDGDAFRLAVDLGIFDSFEFRDQSSDLLCGHYPSHRRIIVELAAKGFRV